MGSRKEAGYRFCKYPVFLDDRARFPLLTASEKLLYMYILDRMGLSEMNGGAFTDEKGRPFVYYTIDEIMKKLGCGREKACKAVNILKRSGLIEVTRKGGTSPNIIRAVIPEGCENADAVKSENRTSSGSESGLHAVRKTDSNNTYINNTEVSHPPAAEDEEFTTERIKEMIDYDLIPTDDEGRKIIDELIMIIESVFAEKGPSIAIGKAEYSRDFVRRRFMQLDCDSIADVVHRVRTNRTRVRDTGAYLRALLFNAPAIVTSETALIYGCNENSVP